MGCPDYFENICNIKSLKKKSQMQQQAYSKEFSFQGHDLSIYKLKSSRKDHRYSVLINLFTVN